MTEISALAGIILFLAFIGFISTMLPSQFQLITPLNFLFLTGQITAIAAACVVTTGIPCAAVLVASFFANLLAIFFSLQTILQTLIITPISIVILYIFMRLAKGGG
jgi:hypothetical protein